MPPALWLQDWQLRRQPPVRGLSPRAGRAGWAIRPDGPAGFPREWSAAAWFTYDPLRLSGCDGGPLSIGRKLGSMCFCTAIRSDRAWLTNPKNPLPP